MHSPIDLNLLIYKGLSSLACAGPKGGDTDGREETQGAEAE